MSDTEEHRICPHCGHRDVPTLIVGRSAGSDGGIGWRCRACHGDWTDGQYRLLRAS
jgi:formate dehydrogenase maturation protein FdhE